MVNLCVSSHLGHSGSGRPPTQAWPAPGLTSCPPLALCPLALPLCLPGGSLLRSLPGCALVFAEALFTCSVLGRSPRLPVSTSPPAVVGLARSFFQKPPPSSLDPGLCRAGLSLPDGTPSFTKAGLWPSVHGSTRSASHEELAHISCSVNIN